MLDRTALTLLGLLLCFIAMADEVQPRVEANVSVETNVSVEANTSVEDNIRAMDTDHDGMVTAHEMRIFLQNKHGKNYQPELMDELEARAGEKSCASPFSRSRY